jgi:Fic family protein
VLALGRLDGIGALLPDPGLFIYMYVRKEAVLSSMIEGTQSSLSDLLLFETEGAPGVPVGDVQEVDNYRAAMEHGLGRLREGFPLSLRLIREIHEILVRGTRGANKAPGEFRTSQNWIGGTGPGDAVYVPPPPHDVMPALANLERFLHGEGDMPLLVRAGLAHVQFETIHPFLDGNGRVGRLLITFLLCARGALSHPLLYVSLHLKMHRTRYYEALQRVRTHGAWEEWLLFFLEGVESVAAQATDTARRILALFEEDRGRIHRQLGGRLKSALLVHEQLKRQPVTTLGLTAARTGLSVPTAGSTMRALAELGITREITGRARDMVFSYERYLAILNEGMEPLPQ